MCSFGLKLVGSYGCNFSNDYWAGWHSDADEKSFCEETYMTAAGISKNIRVGNSPIEIGRYSYGYERMKVRQWGEGASLKIGSFCSIANGLVVMLGGNHRADWATTFPFGHIFEQELGGAEIVGHPSTKGDVTIGNDVWIGQNSTIMSGVSVGDGAIVAANSTVVKNVGCYEIWGGNPAQLIKMRFDDEVVRELTLMKWWDWDIKLIKEIAPILCQAPTLEGLKNLRLLAQLN